MLEVGSPGPRQDLDALVPLNRAFHDRLIALADHPTLATALAAAIHPPIVRRNGPADSAKLAPGYIFLGGFYDLNYPPMVGQSGPLMLDNRLQPVWFRPVPPRVIASNLSLQTWAGKPVLAWWQCLFKNTAATEKGEETSEDNSFSSSELVPESPTNETAKHGTEIVDRRSSLLAWWCW